MTKVIFGAVLYKEAKPYLEDFLNSIEKQTISEFEILILNDNYEVGALKSDKYTLVETGGGFSPATLRVELLLEAKKLGGDLLIIGDADDTFMSNRVEKMLEAYNKDSEAVFYYNDLVNEDCVPVFDNLPSDTGDVNLIDSNFLGMSITAINLNKLTPEWIETLREGDTHIFDWYLFERMILDIGYGVYVSGTGTVYRQHEGNIAGDQKDDVSKEYLEREKAVKLEHYRLMAKRYPRYHKLADKLQKINVSEIIPNKGGFWWSKISVTDEGEN